MAVKTLREPLASAPPPGVQIRALIIEARFYDDIADELLAGAVAEIEAHGAAYERVTVPGALEIPLALAQALAARTGPDDAPNWRFSGAVALGCVIRGETSHYDIVCRNANHWLMDIAVRHAVPVGNGILAAETKAQALARARGGRKGKGGDAARAFLKVLELSRVFHDDAR